MELQAYGIGCFYFEMYMCVDNLAPDSLEPVVLFPPGSELGLISEILSYILPVDKWDRINWGYSWSYNLKHIKIPCTVQTYCFTVLTDLLYITELRHIIWHTNYITREHRGTTFFFSINYLSTPIT
ncbi:hypothetical protein KUTeg_018104 [Tegillarca granosa]|uniref:Uncharacterized protein n=1 Tax=Tegillarca granosa TaxID=220873 RepID=A0ABQ9EGX7_TEGGR|nr:hypothetical protein KUTeg_018104 [Tegillarca granosa]